MTQPNNEAAVVASLIDVDKLFRVNSEQVEAADKIMRDNPARLAKWFFRDLSKIASEYNTAGKFYKVNKLFEKAASAFEEEAKAWNQAKNYHSAESAYHEASECCKQFDSEKRVAFLGKCIEESTNNGSFNMLILRTKECAEVLEEMKQYQQAAKMYTKAAELAREIGLFTGTAHECELGAGRTLAYAEDYVAASSAFLRSIEDCKNDKLHKYSVPKMLFSACICFILSGDYEAAKTHLQALRGVVLGIAGLPIPREYLNSEALVNAVEPREDKPNADRLNEFDRVLADIRSVIPDDKWKAVMFERIGSTLVALQ